MLCENLYTLRKGRKLSQEQVAETAAEDLFRDVVSSQYYTQGIAWAAEKGIVAGYGNGLFGPDDPIAREQLAVMLYRYEQTRGAALLGVGGSSWTSTTGRRSASGPMRPCAG